MELELKYKSKLQQRIVREQDGICQLCFDLTVSIHFEPCGHGVCTECLTQLEKDSLKDGLHCPWDRLLIRNKF